MARLLSRCSRLVSKVTVFQVQRAFRNRSGDVMPRLARTAPPLGRQAGMFVLPLDETPQDTTPDGANNRRGDRGRNAESCPANKHAHSGAHACAREHGPRDAVSIEFEFHGDHLVLRCRPARAGDNRRASFWQQTRRREGPGLIHSPSAEQTPDGVAKPRRLSPCESPGGKSSASPTREFHATNCFYWRSRRDSNP